MREDGDSVPVSDHPKEKLVKRLEATRVRSQMATFLIFAA